jgi:signal transduction histidine kinase
MTSDGTGEAHGDAGMSGSRIGDRLLWSVVAASAVLTALTVLISRFVPDTPPGAVGRVFPRAPRAPGSTGELLRALGIGSLTWYAYILSAPLFVWLSRRLPMDRERWKSSLAIHLVVVIALVLVTAFAQHRLTYADAPFAPPISDYLSVALLTTTLPFIAIAAAAQAIEARSRAHERELEAARSRSQLAEARLEALTAQLQPHFLFNTLQGISTLIGRNPEAADRMLANLSDLLREVLRRADTREVEVAEEVRVLEPYIEIARARFGKRLAITVEVDAEAERALVPFFALQPLVENAVHHGVGSRAGAATIGVDVRRDGEWLRLTVTDDGPGIDEQPRERRGIGLANTQARLRELYGDRQEMTLATVSREGGGSRVSIAIPYRVRAEATREGTRDRQPAARARRESARQAEGER